MVTRLFPERTAGEASRTPPGCVVWAVGDIHGRSDLVDRLFQAIRADLDVSEAKRKVVVLLGDYVDRGLDSRGVLNQICNLAADPGLEVHVLRGNHEEQMELFLRDPSVGPAWCEFGGRATLASYGVQPPVMRNDAAGWTLTCQALGKAIPDFHHVLLGELETSVMIGDYFFAHAGARPGVRLSAQTPGDLMWIREVFLEDAALFEQVVVHGHTPADTVHSDARRIGVDTGAYATNVLSAVRLEDDRRKLMQATSRGGRVAIKSWSLPG